MILSKRETTPDSYVYVAWVATCSAWSNNIRCKFVKKEVVNIYNKKL